MKFYYWKQLLIALAFSLAIFASQFFSTSERNFKQIHSNNIGGNNNVVNSSNELSEGEKLFGYINKALGYLRDGAESELQNKTWINEAQKNLEAALTVLVDSRIVIQPKISRSQTDDDKQQLEVSSFSSTSGSRANPSKTKRFDIGSVLTLSASFVAIVATISTILLSWRKDIREAKAEIRRLKAEAPKIHIP